MGAIKIHIQVNDIYAWGSGFKPEIREIWDNYFSELNNPFWRVVNDNGSTFLVGVYCGGMVHPMDGFTTYLDDLYANDIMIESLKDIFSNLATLCETTWVFSTEYFR